jgi:hypothetical protein
MRFGAISYNRVLIALNETEQKIGKRRNCRDRNFVQNFLDLTLEKEGLGSRDWRTSRVRVMIASFCIKAAIPYFPHAYEAMTWVETELRSILFL